MQFELQDQRRNLMSCPAAASRSLCHCRCHFTVTMSLRPVNDCHLMQSAQMQLVFDTHAHESVHTGIYSSCGPELMQKSTQLDFLLRNELSYGDYSSYPLGSRFGLGMLLKGKWLLGRSKSFCTACVLTICFWAYRIHCWNEMEME